jgi:hypothetical protein
LENVHTSVRLACQRTPFGQTRDGAKEITRLAKEIKKISEEFMVWAFTCSGVRYSGLFQLVMNIQTHERVRRVEESVDFIRDNMSKHHNALDNSRLTRSIDDEITKLEVVGDIIGEHHSPCLPHTRKKVLHSIREWAQDPTSPQILWLTDVAGAGKSTIAKHLSDEWRREGRQAAASSSTKIV